MNSRKAKPKSKLKLVRKLNRFREERVLTATYPKASDGAPKIESTSNTRGYASLDGSKSNDNNQRDNTKEDYLVKSSKECLKPPYNPYKRDNTQRTTVSKSLKPLYNPYKKENNYTKRPVIKSILKRGNNSNWYLTTKRGNLNYSPTFNGPVDDGECLILKRPVKHNLGVTFGADTVYSYKLPENYNPWDYVAKMDSTVKLLKPYKF